MWAELWVGGDTHTILTWIVITIIYTPDCVGTVLAGCVVCRCMCVLCALRLHDSCSCCQHSIFGGYLLFAAQHQQQVFANQSAVKQHRTVVASIRIDTHRDRIVV